MTSAPNKSPWTPALVTAIGGAVGVVLTALAAVLVTLQGLRQEQRDTAKKADVIIEKAAEIHSLTNSNLAAVTKTLAVAQARIDGLEALVASQVENKKVADDLAAKAQDPTP